MTTLLSRPPKRRDRFALYSILTVLVALGTQVVLYLLVMENTLGPFHLFSRPKSSHPSMTRELRVALLRSGSTAKMSASRPEYYFDLESHWESVLQEARIPYRVISDAELATAVNDTYSVLVLPWASCLGDPQRRAISNAVEQGFGLVASGALGTRDADCSWRGWDYLTQIVGIKSPYTVQTSETFNAAFRGGRFYSPAIPAGMNIELPRQEFVAGNAQAPDIYWADWKLRPAQGESPGQSALAVHASRGQGRVAWFGFAETPPAGNAVHRAAMRHYLASCVRWVGRQPLAVVGDWPARKRAAVMIAEEVQQIEAAAASAEVFQQERVPAVFFCNSAAARMNPTVLAKLKAVGEVASAGDSADPFGDQPGATQTDRLLRAKRELEVAAPVTVMGFHAPQGSANAETVASVTNAGYLYYLDSADVRRAVPEVVEQRVSSLLPLPRNESARIYRASSDDFEIIANYRGPTPWGDDLAEGFLNEFRRMEYVGGLYPLVFRSDLLGSPENLHVLRRIVQQIKAEPVWIASGESLVRWWSDREKLRVDVRKISAHRLRVAITNRGQRDIEDASVYVHLPYRPKNLRITSAVLRLQLPYSELTGDDDVLRLDLPTVKRQSSYVFLVALDE